jgi:hypothetical protein
MLSLSVVSIRDGKLLGPIKIDLGHISKQTCNLNFTVFHFTKPRKMATEGYVISLLMSGRLNPTWKLRDGVMAGFGMVQKMCR